MLARWSASTRALRAARRALAARSGCRRRSAPSARPASRSASDLAELRHGAHDPPRPGRRWSRSTRRRGCGSSSPSSRSSRSTSPRRRRPSRPRRNAEEVDVRELAQGRPPDGRGRAAARGRPRPRQRRGLVAAAAPAHARGGRARPPPRALSRAARRRRSRPGTTRTRCATRSASAGAGGGWLSLRLPGRRSGPLRPTPVLGQGGAVPWDSGVAEHLTRALPPRGRAARAGRRHRARGVRPRRPAAHAARRGRRCSSATACTSWPRSWPRAASWTPGSSCGCGGARGDRGGRSRVARARGAFGGGDRARATIPSWRTRCRAAWVESERARGDHRAAVEVAWPDERLRAGSPPTWPRSARSAGARRRPASRSSSRGGPIPAVAAEAVGAACATASPASAWRCSPAWPSARPPTRRPTAGWRRSACARCCATAPAGRVPRAGGRSSTGCAQRADPLLRADLPPFPASVPSDARHLRGRRRRSGRDRDHRRRLAVDRAAGRGGRARPAAAHARRPRRAALGRRERAAGGRRPRRGGADRRAGRGRDRAPPPRRRLRPRDAAGHRSRARRCRSPTTAAC